MPDMAGRKFCRNAANSIHHLGCIVGKAERSLSRVWPAWQIGNNHNDRAPVTMRDIV